jgi:glycosyltransferase involved in cell wall biosynthesis
MKKTSIKILHGPHDIGGNAYMLARGERMLGLHSENLVYTKQWYGYKADHCLNLVQDSNPVFSPRWWTWMLCAALRYDVFHFNFGASFLTYYPERWVYVDLPLWRAMGISTFVTFQGCEGRLSDFAMKNFEVQACSDCPGLNNFCAVGYDQFKREILANVGRYFDRVFALNPDLMHHLPGAVFLPYANCDLDTWQPPQGFDFYHSGPVRILHAPTNRKVKGTEAIVAAVQELNNEGVNVELVLVENIPYSQVKDLYESVDLLVDQILVGWYGGLAVELMALGKPVVAYLRENDLGFLPRAMREEIPVVNANPARLKDTLKRLIQDPALRQSLGERSRAYAERWHHPQKVAEITTGEYLRALEKHPPLNSTKRLAAISWLVKPTARVLATVYNNTFRSGLSSRLGRK